MISRARSKYVKKSNHTAVGGTRGSLTSSQPRGDIRQEGR